MRVVAYAVLVLLCASPVSAQGGWTGELFGPRARRDLRSPDAATRLSAAHRLGRRGENRHAVSALLEALSAEEEAGVRGAIFDSLARRGDEAAIDALAQRLTEWGRDDRAAALRAMGAIGGERAIRLLVEWLGAADVGDDAVDALGLAGAPAVPHLLRALAVPIASARAAVVLGRIGDTRATEPLVARLRSALPAARIEMLRALGAIGDERASSAIQGFLSESDPDTVSAALEALALVSGPERARPVASLADRGTSGQRAVALRALVVMDPVAAAPRVRSVLEDIAAPAILRRAAFQATYEHPTAPMRSVLARLLDDVDQRLPAAEALSRIPDGAGVSILFERALVDPDRSLDAALALAVRRHQAVLGSTIVERARAHLRGDHTSRGLVLSALALDPAVRTEVGERLGAGEPVERAHAALAVILLGDIAHPVRGVLVSRLLEESDALAFRALALAALWIGAPVDSARIDARWWDPATAPEALWLAAANLDAAAPRTRRRARRAMRRSLRAAQPRVRAGAAVALAIAGDRASWRALVAALEDEHEAVRLAVARALGALAVDDASEPIASHMRVETNAPVRDALRQSIGVPGRRPPPPIGRGEDVLYVRISTAAGLSRGPELAVDVLLADGRWLQTVALSTGEVLVPDLPAGEAEVQLRLDR